MTGKISKTTEYCNEIEKACSFIVTHYAEPLSLDLICDDTGLSKSTLLRAFTKYKGITPYRFLETVRIGEAKKLLEQGITPAEAALRTGFSDQSHLTNRFRSQIGLTPGMYRAVFLELQEKDDAEIPIDNRETMKAKQSS